MPSVMDRLPDGSFAERLREFSSTRFTELREPQRLVLDQYGAHHTGSADVAIEMPTGEGKTLVALLIADYALDQGLSVAYLAGNRVLAEDVEDQAKDLGLEAVRFSGRNYGGAKLADYNDGQAVGVMNYWVYFNASPKVDSADLVIFDDAHLAEQPLSGMQTLRVPARAPEGRDLYSALCGLVLARTATAAYPALRSYLEGSAPRGSAPELLSFRDWAEVADAARDIVDQSKLLQDDDSARYVWRAVRDNLDRVGVLIGPDAIEMRPYHPPTSILRHYRRAKQRLYLSATLGSMDDLQRRIGGNSIVKLVPSQPLPVGQTGDRLFAINPTGVPAADPAMMDWALSHASRAGGRVAWLCASNSEADDFARELRARTLPVFRLRAGNDDTISRWLAASTGHLVTAGRYDGMDLGGGQCRLVVVPSVPQASSEFERFTVAYLGDASFMRHRVGQRITQALGRANRYPDDRALYLGLDPRFAQILADPAVQRSIPASATAAVNDALRLYDEGPDQTFAACDRFWTQTGAQHPAATGSSRRRPGRGATPSGTSSADDEIEAATELWVGSNDTAAAAAERAAASLADAGEIEHSAFWRYVQAHALFNEGGRDSLVAAERALRAAITDGPRTAWFRRLSRTAESLRGVVDQERDHDDLFFQWDELRRRKGERLNKHLVSIRARLLATHNERCLGLVDLAELAGALGNRKPAKEQAATDAIWTWSTHTSATRRVWEVKTSKNPLSRDDVNQNLGQIEVETRREPDLNVLGCMYVSVSDAKTEALEAAENKIALLTEDAVVTLFDVLADRLRQYDRLCGEDTARLRGEARTIVERRMPSSGWMSDLLAPSGGRMLTAADVNALFP